YGAELKDFAEIARVNHAHSAKNPYSQFRDVYTLEQILASPMLHEPLTKLQCCPTSDGGAAAIVVSEAFLAARPHLRSQAVLMAGQCLATDAASLFNRSSISLMGFDMSQHAAKTALDEAGVSARDVQVCELHDCFSANEMITLDALGLCEPGKAHEMVRNGDITYGGRCVVNPSGGLISKGHPLGATGIAQCAELVWQLRGWADNRLVKGAKVALQHNLGLGGAVVCTVYKRADGQSNEDVSAAGIVGYNPAVEARGFTKEQVDRLSSCVVASKLAASSFSSLLSACKKKKKDLLSPSIMDPNIRKEIISNHGPLIASSMSTAMSSKKSKGTFSVEDSGPPSPTSGPVINFGQVVPGIYRSSFPMSGNFEHLRSLGLKTILTLVPQDYPAENVAFMEESSIQHFQVPIPAHKDESVKIPLHSIASALEILLNVERHPVLIHCNKGKHRTGCIVACYRMLNHWSPAAVITEYRKYAGLKARLLDEIFISQFDVPGMLALLKLQTGGKGLAAGVAGANPMMLPTPPASERDCEVEDDAWTLHVGI
ncbi:MAG: hypothetical protein Q9170_007809, partial [Blastenia crenularia]